MNTPDPSPETLSGSLLLASPALRDPNILVLALKGAPPRVRWQALRERAALLEARFGLPFARYLNALRKMNQHDADDLVIVAEEGAAG